MLSRMGTTFALLAFIVSVFYGAAAQTTSATCMSSFNWALNSRKQSPCVVASYLLGTCSDQPYNVEALPENSHYSGPTLATANSCQCSTVVYSLLSACGECQNRTIQSWSTWTTNCPHVDISTFAEPIPAGTKIPGWAYFDVKAHDQFDVDLAKQNANSTSYTESSAAPKPTSSFIPPPSSAVTKTSSSAAAASSAAAPSSNSASAASGISPRNDAIIGGIVGGILGLILVGGIALWFLHRQREVKDKGQLLESPVMSHTQAPSGNIPPTRGSVGAEKLSCRR
ncbi:hypothetical protein HGRIS_012877 [Hohenbuehelia grisea]|uniref:Uncharacterized protein n=1 Tax=Hohenbuehelia grisea TaxID=104357 RepID=A0ABR3ITN7_9AGAR